MKKIFLLAIVVISVLVGGYYLYRTTLPDLVAKAVVSESLPDYIPKRIQIKIQAISVPLNKGTEAVIEEMHSSNIPMKEILSVVDKTTEEEAYRMLDEINSTRPETTNEVFDVGKKYISADFDVEIFRKHFNDHLSMKQVKTAINFANQNRKTHDLDFTTAKAIMKKILLEKEKEYNQKKRDQ